MLKYSYFLALFILFAFSIHGFKEEQLKYSRVRQAYQEKDTLINKSLSEKKLQRDAFQLYIRAFKAEKELEIWAKNDSSLTFTLLKTIAICDTSGQLGPKRQRGDLQIPEGFYHINRFNPYSNFHLSLGINYPNASDKVLGNKSKLGGDIFIHGDCVTIGCLPLTNDLIKEVYIYCVEAKNNGQTNIPVSIFPTRLNDANFNLLKEKYAKDTDKLNLWEDLKKGYDLFNTYRQLPSIKFLPSGRHEVKM